MGAYAPLTWAPDGLVDDVVARVAQPVVDEMHRRGTPFAGVLYVGLALTARGPAGHRVQRALRRPRDAGRAGAAADPAGRAAARGRHRAGSTTRRRCAGPTTHAVTVVVAADELPRHAAHRRPDQRARRAAERPTAYVLHAGTARDADGAARLRRRPGAVGRRHRVDLAQARERRLRGRGRHRPARARTTAPTSPCAPSAARSPSASRVGCSGGLLEQPPEHPTRVEVGCVSSGGGCPRGCRRRRGPPRRGRPVRSARRSGSTGRTTPAPRRAAASSRAATSPGRR